MKRKANKFLHLQPVATAIALLLCSLIVICRPTVAATANADSAEVEGYPVINAQEDKTVNDWKNSNQVYAGEQVLLNSRALFHSGETTYTPKVVKSFVYKFQDAFFAVDTGITSGQICFTRGDFGDVPNVGSAAPFLTVTITVNGNHAEYVLDWRKSIFQDATISFPFEGNEVGLFLTVTENKMQFFCADTENGPTTVLAEYAADSQEYLYLYDAFFSFSLSAWLSFTCNGNESGYLSAFDEQFNGVFYGKAELPETPTQAELTFVGWYYDAALTQPYRNGSIWSYMVFYPKFGAQIIWDMQGGETIAPLVVDLGTTPQLPTPTRAGYRFMGWQLNGEPYTPEPVAENITITAVWLQGDYIVTFIVDGEIYTQIGVDENSILGG